MFLNNPEFVKINNIQYKINTDYRVAIECESVARDETISDYERSLAIIYLLYGDEGLASKNDYTLLLELGIKYLSCGQDRNIYSNEERDMDYKQDMHLIKASFRHDYGINLDNEKMHWWDFYNLLNGLSNSELGDCCILNRIRNLRKFDTSKIEDQKERKQIEEAKMFWNLKDNVVKTLSIEQQRGVDTFYELTGIERK